MITGTEWAQGRPPGAAEIYNAFYLKPHEVLDLSKFISMVAHLYGKEPASSKLLDMGCGTGRLLRAFAAAGWTIYGVEPDASYLECAERVKSDCEGEMELYSGKFSDFQIPDSVELIVAINGSFAYQLEFEERLESLRRAYQALNPGGVILIDIANFLHYMKFYSAIAPRKAELGEFEVEITTEHAQDLVRARWEHIDYIRCLSKGALLSEQIARYQFAIISWPELEWMLKNTGFKNIMTFNGYQSTKAESLSGSRIVVSAQKENL